MSDKINWEEVETKAEITLEEKYRETKSLRKTGEYFGKYWGVYAISQNTISAELKKRGVKINSKGGPRRTERIKSKEYADIIKALPTHNMTRAHIKQLTRLNDSQFDLAQRYFPFEYKKLRNVDLSEYLKKYNCKNRKELLIKLYAQHRSTLTIGNLLDRAQFTIRFWMEKEGIERDRTGVNAKYKGVVRI